MTRSYYKRFELDGGFQFRIREFVVFRGIGTTRAIKTRSALHIFGAGESRQDGSGCIFGNAITFGRINSS